MKKEIAVGICFCLAGVLAAWLFGYEYFSTYGFLNEYHMQTFAKAEFDTPALLGNILWENVSDYRHHFLYPLKKNYPAFSEVRNLFYRRNVSCCMHDEYGMEGTAVFYSFLAAAWISLFAGTGTGLQNESVPGLWKKKCGVKADCDLYGDSYSVFVWMRDGGNHRCFTFKTDYQYPGLRKRQFSLPVFFLYI